METLGDHRSGDAVPFADGDDQYEETSLVRAFANTLPELKNADAYEVYEKAEKGFAERYLDMLAAGGTKHHKELLAPFGLDASDPNFWSMGLKVIENLIDELEALYAVPATA